MPKSARDIWLNSLASQCAGADEPVITLELTNTIREFFESSNSWQVDLGPYTVEDGVDLDLNAELKAAEGICTADATVVRVLGLRVGDTVGRPITYNPIHTFSNTPVWSCPEPHIVHFVNSWSETQTDACTIRVVLTPNSCSTRLPDYMGTLYFDAVLSGTLSRLMAYADGRPFANPMMAVHHGKRFRNFIAKYRDIAARKFTTADPQWAYPGGWP